MLSWSNAPVARPRTMRFRPKVAEACSGVILAPWRRASISRCRAMICASERRCSSSDSRYMVSLVRSCDSTRSVLLRQPTDRPRSGARMRKNAIRHGARMFFLLWDTIPIASHSQRVTRLESYPTGLSGSAGQSREHGVHQAVALGLLGGHEVVAVAVLFNLLVALARVFHQDVVEHFLEPLILLQADQDLRRTAAHAAQGLVDHDARVGQAVAFARGARAQEDGAHAGGPAEIGRAHAWTPL